MFATRSGQRAMSTMEWSHKRDRDGGLRTSPEAVELFSACEDGNEECAGRLLAAHPDAAGARRPDGMTPLMTAAISA